MSRTKVCLDNYKSIPYGPDRYAIGTRCGDRRGGVHRAPPTRAPPASPVPAWSASPASTPERAKEAAARLGADRAFRDRPKRWSPIPRSMWCTCACPNDLHAPLATDRARARQARHLREAIDPRRRVRRRAGRQHSASPAPSVQCRSCTGSTRWSREMRARIAADELGCAAPGARHVPPGLARRLGRHRLAIGSQLRWPVACLRRHRLALVRPRRVRHRSNGSTGLSGEALARMFDGREQRGHRARTVRARRAAPSGSVVVSQVAAGRKNALVVECSGTRWERPVRPGSTGFALARAARASRPS